MTTPNLKNSNREPKLDFASDATLATLFAGAINTPILFTLFVDNYTSLSSAFGFTILNMIWFLLAGMGGLFVGGLALRILIYCLFYSKKDANEKTAYTMAGGSLIIILVMLYHFHYYPSYFPNNYQSFAFFTFPMLLVFNAYTWYWNIWGASNYYFKGIENTKSMTEKLFYN